ncbi:NAD(P)/FAD-dependent oxidoreductase [Nesterenkonia sp. MY13]|uniref:NAD(P)/FAD-dependent oxidoreductase n=1 Tax=Nesterenkonia sedimenti TaxID=1463632 RepID=A0A7X8TJP1_9MICC|nr:MULTISPECIES: NAD(P)/FAD-dependent oxidoreductase [Nesterenkonia]NLS09811.1 NAD(P)/FAD-dependent oxidoreductase [Nesterenkonia sedimenti]
MSTSTSLPAYVDALVIGGGAAGLSAATWLGRYQRRTLVADAGQHRNRFADQVHGLLGRDPISPRELLNQARADLAQYHQVSVYEATVSALEPTGQGRFQATIDGAKVIADRVVLATGVRDQWPPIAGVDAHCGVDVHHCPACDGYKARGGTVVVLGAGEHVPAYAAELLDWAETVRIVTNPTDRAFDEAQRATLAEHGISVVEGVAQALIGLPGALEGLRLKDGTVVEAQKVFFSYSHHPTNDLALQLECELDDHGQIAVDGYQLTSVDGVYAAGDITPGMQLVSVAIAEGAVAGVACATSMRGHHTNEHAPSPAPPTRRFTMNR